MPVRQTSRDAYRDSGPRRSTIKDRILASLRAEGPATNLELSRRLSLAINTVTPGTNSLVKDALAREARRRPCRVSGVTAIEWEATSAVTFTPTVDKFC